LLLLIFFAENVKGLKKGNYTFLKKIAIFFIKLSSDFDDNIKSPEAKLSLKIAGPLLDTQNNKKAGNTADL
jgi:hypothetical protein